MKIVTFPPTIIEPSCKLVAVLVCCFHLLLRAFFSGFSKMSENQQVNGEQHLDELAAKEQGPMAHRGKNLKRRSSIQKIIHMCNQSYQVFPHVFLWVQDFQTSLLADLRKVIPLVKSMLALRLGVYLSIALLSAELVYCLIGALTVLVPSGSFFFFCIGVLSLLAFQVFDVALELRKKLRGSFFVKKKKIN